MESLSSQSSLKSSLREWLAAAEKAPNFRTLLQNKYFELRDEMENEGLRFQETVGVFPHSGTPDGFWHGVRCTLAGQGLVFQGTQVGQDWMARFNALCKAYLDAKEWLLSKS